MNLETKILYLFAGIALGAFLGARHVVDAWEEAEAERQERCKPRWVPAERERTAA